MTTLQPQEEASYVLKINKGSSLEVVCDITSGTEELWVECGVSLLDITGPEMCPKASG